MPLDQRAVAGGPPRRMQRDQIQRRRIGGAVIRRVRDQLEMRQLAVAQLVQDLARLGVAVVVALRRLLAPQNLQRTARRIPDRRSSFCNETIRRVAAEQRHEPRQPRCRHEHHVIGALQSAAARRPCPRIALIDSSDRIPRCWCSIFSTVRCHSSMSASMVRCARWNACIPAVPEMRFAPSTRS